MNSKILITLSKNVNYWKNSNWMNTSWKRRGKTLLELTWKEILQRYAIRLLIMLIPTIVMVIIAIIHLLK